MEGAAALVVVAAAAGYITVAWVDGLVEQASRSRVGGEGRGVTVRCRWLWYSTVQYSTEHKYAMGGARHVVGLRLVRCTVLYCTAVQCSTAVTVARVSFEACFNVTVLQCGTVQHSSSSSKGRP